MNASKILELATNNKLDEIIHLAKLEIKEQAIKEKGGNQELKRFRAAQKYIKNIDKSYNNRWSGTWEENGKQCLANGVTAFILNNKIEGLPRIENDFNLHNVLKNVDKDLIEIKVDIADIKAAIKIHKATHEKNSICNYDLGISLYNAQHILDCYNILGGNIVFKQSKDKVISPAIMESENGIAILLPTRRPKVRKVEQQND